MQAAVCKRLHVCIYSERLLTLSDPCCQGADPFYLGLYRTQLYANPNAFEEKIQRIVEMGFSKEAASRAIQAAGGDENVALEALLGG